MREGSGEIWEAEIEEGLEVETKKGFTRFLFSKNKIRSDQIRSFTFSRRFRSLHQKSNLCNIDVS